MELRNVGVLVTGASRGLGAALAKELARRGAHVVAVARGEEALAKVVEEIRVSGGIAHAIAADIGDKRAIHAITGAAAALVGSVELLVNNASTLGAVPLRSLLDTDCESLEEALAVNVLGPFRLTKVLVGSMLLRKRGLVVNLTSDASIAAYENWGAYSASKAALDHLTRIWGAELSGCGVQMVSVDPGEMRTKMHADALPDADEATLLDPALVAERIVTLIGRAATLPNGARVQASAYARIEAA